MFFFIRILCHDVKCEYAKIAINAAWAFLISPAGIHSTQMFSLSIWPSMTRPLFLNEEDRALCSRCMARSIDRAISP